MPESRVVTFDYKEIAEALIKREGIHEGLWGIFVEFGLGAGYVPGQDKDTQVPGAVVPILRIGIQIFPSSTPLTVDAAEVNPSKQSVGKNRPTRKMKTTQE